MNANLQVPSRTLRRLISSVPFVQNTTLSVELPKEHWYKKLHVRLQGSHIVSSALTLSGGIMALLKNINAKANGTITPKNANSYMFYNLARLNNGIAPRQLETLLTVATHPVFVDIPLNFSLPRRVSQPYSTMLDSDPFKTFQLFIQTGALADVYSAGASTLSATTLEIWSEEIVPNRVSRFDLNQESQLDLTWTAANSKLTMDLPLGGMYKSILFKVSDSGTANDTSVNRITALINGTEILYSLTWDELQDMNQLDYGIAPTVGYALLDFDERGAGEELIPSQNLSTFKIEFDVDATTAGKIEMLPTIIYPNPLS